MGNRAWMRDHDIRVPDAIAAEAGAEILVARAGVLLGTTVMADAARPEAARAMSAMRHFAGTIGVDTIGIVLAALGFLSPLPAAAIHVISEMIFILNSARLLPALENKRRGLVDSYSAWVGSH